MQSEKVKACINLPFILFSAIPCVISNISSSSLVCIPVLNLLKYVVARYKAMQQYMFEI